MVLTVESASRGYGPESRLKSHFFIAHCSGWTWNSVFAAKVAFGSVYIAVMLCRKQREQASGVGCSAAKAVSAAKVVDWDDNDEDRWTEDDDEETDAGSR